MSLKDNATLEELENYKKHYDEVLNREMKFNNKEFLNK